MCMPCAWVEAGGLEAKYRYRVYYGSTVVLSIRIPLVLLSIAVALSIRILLFRTLLSIAVVLRTVEYSSSMESQMYQNTVEYSGSIASFVVQTRACFGILRGGGRMGDGGVWHTSRINPSPCGSSIASFVVH